MTDDTAERRARVTLAWALITTPLRLPPGLEWHWRPGDATLAAQDGDDRLTFHVAEVSRGSGQVRVAVLETGCAGSSVTWELAVPEDADDGVA